jgi:DNA-binding CsgD family transcriptional regulator
MTATVPSVDRRKGPRLPVGPPRSPVSLTPAQLRVVRLICRGLTVKEAAAVLEISVNTLNVHLYAACGKLGIRHRAQLILWGARVFGLIQ